MIAAPPDLLVIGGLTVDRFADGSSAPGGSILHVARAATARGVRVWVMTVAGPEPEARAVMDEFMSLGLTASFDGAETTATFIHRDSPEGRRLRLERAGGPITIADLDPGDARAILVAPIADEVATDDIARLDATTTRGAILQGFLRSFAPDGEVQPLPLSALAPDLVAILGQFDLLVASREDLVAEATQPSDQLVALRRRFGPRPELVVTDGVRGAWNEREHLAVPRRVDGVPSVGAGDIFAAFILAGGWPRPASTALLRQRTKLAMSVVVEVLEERRA